MTVNCHDNPEHGGFDADYRTDTPDCAPYYALHIGANLTIFIDADRMKMLEDVLKVARCERETAEALASMEAA